MMCENCGENEASVKYTQIINGEKRQIFLCEECSEKLGIDDIKFNMPIDFSSFLSDFFGDMQDATFIPKIGGVDDELKCSKCGLTFDDFIHIGKFGCSNCYDEFESKIDPILKNIQGSSRHVGRLGKVIEGNNINKKENEKNIDKIQTLKDELRKAIKEERYEDAAKIRDELKKEE